MKKRVIIATVFFFLMSLPVFAQSQDYCQNMQAYIGFMQQLASGLKAKADMDDSEAIGDKLNDLIGFLRQVDEREDNAALSHSLENLEKVWLNQSFDTTNRDELGEALGQSATELQKVYNLRCNQ